MQRVRTVCRHGHHVKTAGAGPGLRRRQPGLRGAHKRTALARRHGFVGPGQAVAATAFDLNEYQRFRVPANDVQFKLPLTPVTRQDGKALVGQQPGGGFLALPSQPGAFGGGIAPRPVRRGDNRCRIGGGKTAAQLPKPGDHERSGSRASAFVVFSGSPVERASAGSPPAAAARRAAMRASQASSSSSSGTATPSQGGSGSRPSKANSFSVNSLSENSWERRGRGTARGRRSRRPSPPKMPPGRGAPGFTADSPVQPSAPFARRALPAGRRERSAGAAGRDRAPAGRHNGRPCRSPCVGQNRRPASAGPARS